MLVYWSVPLALLLIWCRYLIRRDWPVTVLHIVSIATAVGISFLFQWLMQQTARGQYTLGDPLFQSLFKEYVGRDKPKGIIIYIVLLMVMLLGITLCHQSGLSSWIPFIGADVSSRIVSDYPNGSSNEALPSVSGRNFYEMNLRSLVAQGAKVAKSNFSRTVLDRANLSDVDARGADFSFASMVNVRLDSGRLTAATLTGADLSEAMGSRADLSEVEATGVFANNANVSDANFEGANLKNGRLRAAELTSAKFIRSDLSHADLEGATLLGCTLERANLTMAHAFGSNFQGCDFTGAILDGADLRGADLRVTRGLTPKMLLTIRCDSETQFPRSIADATRRCGGATAGER